MRLRRLLFLLGAVIAVLVIAAACLLVWRYGREPSHFKVDAARDVATFREWWDKVFYLPSMEIESTTPDRHTRVRVQKDFLVPMRDGVRLSTDVYTPDAGGPFPVILIRMPYGKRESYCYMPVIGRFWARKGYAFVAQDVRGRFDSEGVFDLLLVNEEDDGYDTLEWIARQPWSNGKVGMMGESYYGYTTWAAAVSRHPSLRAVAPSTTSMNEFYGTLFRGGALSLQTMGLYYIEMDHHRAYQNTLRLDMWHLPLASLAKDAGLSDRFYSRLFSSPARSEAAGRASLRHRYADVTIPALHLGGWYDMFIHDTLADWRGIRENSASAEARDRQWLLIGPWDHEYTPESTHRIGRVEIGGASALNRWDTLQTFFDHWLMGVDNGFEKTPLVRFFTIGANEWRSASEWPPASTSTLDLYFHSGGKAHLAESDGTLDETPPASEPADGYVYDPEDPVALAMEEELWSRAEYLQDRAPLAQRQDVLVYDTSPLDAGLEITGPVTVTLYASSSATDTDFTAALVDLHPDGYAHLIQEGIIRASYQGLEKNPLPREPGRVVEYPIDLWATSYVVQAGHRIRVEVSSSNFDRYDRNPNTGEPFGTAVKTIPASQTIFHTAEHPSRITLPRGSR